MVKRICLTLAILFVVFGAVFAWHFKLQHIIRNSIMAMGQQAPVVSASAAQSQNWQPYISAVGDLTAIRGVDISPELAGQVKAIFFRSGQQVSKGQPLIQLDEATEQAQLKIAKAQLQLATINLDRTKRLLAQKASTQSALDDANSNVTQLKANLENINSIIAKKLIRAPFNGKIGINQINLGQFVAAGQLCTSLQTTDALYVKFSLAQKEISKIKLKQNVLISTDAYPASVFKGFVSAVDSKLDDNTHTIEIQATLDNTQKKLYPGMFVNVKVLLPVVANTVTLPQTSITYTLYGESAFVVTLDENQKEGPQVGTVKRVFVRTGDKQGNLAVILEGIHPGDLVVNSGQTKLDEGSRVVLNNTIPL